MGIERIYADNVLCGYCYPVVGTGTDLGKYVKFAGSLMGAHAPEHLLIRAVRNGLLGITTNTNTKMRELQANLPPNINEIVVYLPNARWGRLEGQKTTGIINGSY